MKGALAALVVLAFAAPPGQAARAAAPSSARVVSLRAPSSPRVRLPGGTFMMGSVWADLMYAFALCRKELHGAHCESMQAQRLFRAELNAHPVTLSPFEIDRTEVSVGAYARCVSAGACAPAGFTPGDPRFDRPELPVTFVRWEDAVAYCAWDGGRLPTEAEWEFAARGPSSRTFPWGSFYNSRVCNHGAFSSDETDGIDGFVGLSPVGSFPDGRTPEGLFDMAGNVSEWVADFFSVDEASGEGYSTDPQTNPTGTATSGPHVIRGGSYVDGAAWMRTTHRAFNAIGRAPQVGFRCARGV